MFNSNFWGHPFTLPVDNGAFLRPNLAYHTILCLLFKKRGWDKSPSLSIIFGLSSKTQWLSGLYYADFINFYSPTQLCGGGTTKSNTNELPISVPLSLSLFLFRSNLQLRKLSPHRENRGLSYSNLQQTYKQLPKHLSWYHGLL